MPEINQVTVKLFLPNGAFFKEDVNLLCLKSLLALIRQLSCINKKQSCERCVSRLDCEYHKSTGENFQYYPGILVYNDLFTKYVYAENEELMIRFYLIGNNLKWANYIRLLFELYLKGTIAGHTYILEDIDIVELISDTESIQELSIVSIIESQNFIQSYNSMISYYNTNYGTSFHIVGNYEYRIESLKHTSMDHITIGKRNINPQGFLYHIIFQKPIGVEKIVKQIGVGRFNFIGGGRYED